GNAPVSIHALTNEAATITVAGSAANARTTAAGAFDLAGLTLVEGTNRFTLHAVDEAGNAVDVPYSFVLRTVTPDVEVVDNGIPIADNAIFNHAVAPSLRSTIPDATLAATLNGQPFTSGTNIGADNSYTLVATATAAGHTTTTTLHFTIDRTPPVVTIASPANNATVDAAQAVVTGNAGDGVTLTVNGTSVTPGPNGSFTASVALDFGENPIVASGRDRAGNTGSATVTITRTGAGTGIVLTSPGDATTTNRRTTVVSGRILTPSGARSLSLEGKAGSRTTGAIAVAFDPAGGFTVPDFPLFEGANTITATLTSTNDKAASASVTVTDDLTPPVLQILANGQPLEEGARFPSAVELTVALTADAGNVTPELRLDGAVVTTPASVSTNGSHTVLATAADTAGNQARVVRTFSIGAAATAGCNLGNFDPVAGSVIGAASVTITGTSGGAAGVKVNGVPARVANGSFAGTAELTVEGSNDVAIACTDAAGAALAGGKTLPLVRAINAPTVTISDPAEMANRGTATTSVSGTIGAGVVSVDVNGKPAVLGAGTWTASAVPLSSGLNVLVARAKNAAGRVATASRRVVYLLNAPILIIDWPGDAYTTGAATTDISGTWTNLDPSTIAAGGTAAETRVGSSTTGTFVVRGVPLAAGPQQLTVTGRDVLGRPASATVQVTREAGTPSIAIASPLDGSYVSSATVPVSGTWLATVEGAQIDVNGVAATLAGSPLGGTFSAVVPVPASGTPSIVARITQPGDAVGVATVFVTRLASAPTVKNVFPAADAVGVGAGVIPLIGFSAPMELDSIRAALVLLNGAGAPVDGQLRLDKDIVSFAPGVTLTAGERYTIVVRTTAKDLAGNALAQELRSSFTIATTAGDQPRLDAIASPFCGSELIVSGIADAAARVEISIGGVPQYVVADAAGRFTAKLSIPQQSGIRVARVRTVGGDGTFSPAAEALFEIDCAGPVVTGTTYDRTANRIAVTFSKPVDPATANASSIALALGDGTSVSVASVAAGASPNAVVITPGTPDARAAILVLTISTALRDTTGRPLAAPYRQTFTPGGVEEGPGGGAGYISGQVFDASTGRPLANATVTIAPSAPAIARTTDATGRYTSAAGEGAYTIHAFANGYTDVWRQVVVPAGAGIVPIDIRLSARGPLVTAASGELTPPHGGDTSITRRVTLRVASGAVPNGTSIVLTSVGAQSLAGLLPLGWSPLAAAEVRVTWPGTAASNAAATLAFDVPSDLAGRSLAAVQYDASRDEWRVLQPAVAIASSTATFPIALPESLGAFALVYGDALPELARPPSPAAGAVLAGVTDPCASRACAPLEVSSFPLEPSIVLPNGRTAATLIVNGAPVVAVPTSTNLYPSGTAVQAFVNEELRLTDGSVDLSQPFSTDLVLYRSLNGTQAKADFHLAPSARAATVPLQVGFDHIQVFPYPGRLDRGTLVGPAGGPIPSDDRVQVELPTGAAPAALHATATSIDNLSQFTVDGFQVLAGFTLALDRTDGSGAATLLKGANATFTVDAAALGATPQFIVAEVLGSTPYGPLFRMVANTAAPQPIGGTAKARVTTAPIDPSKLPLDGIVRPGRYLLLLARQPIAFALGGVRLGNGGPAVDGAQVASSTLGVADVSRPTGLFAVPVIARPAAPFALTPSHPTTGSGAASVAQTSPDPATNVNVGDLVLAAQPPLLRHLNVVAVGGALDLVTVPNGRDVVLTTGVQAQFSQSLDPTSVTPSAIVVTDSSGRTVSGTAAGSGSTVTWTATAGSTPFAPNERYIVTVAASLRGSFGAPLGTPSTFGFSTVTVVTNAQIHAEKIHITIPDANGVSTIFGDPGALPTVPPEIKAWRGVALRRGRAFITQYQVTAANDGSFSFRIGTCSGAAGSCADRVALTDRIDLEILNAADNIAAVLPLGPFSSADGQAFVAPTDVDVTYTSRDGVSVRVPAGAFDQPATIRITRVDDPAPLTAIPHFAEEMNFAGGVKLDIDCGAGVADCHAKSRLDVTIPIPSTVNPAGRNFILGWLGDSVRGPRLMIVDTLRVEGGNFTSVPDPATGAAMKTIASNASGRIASNATLTGPQVKKFLVGVNRSGIFAVIDLHIPEAGAAGWAAIDGLQGNYDIFWDSYAALFASHLYLLEPHGRIIVPVVLGRPFELVGVDAGTGLQAFSKVYNPLPLSDPGAAYIVDSPMGGQSGPYPVFALPNRVEVVDLNVENEPILSVANFSIRLQGGYAYVGDSSINPLPGDIDISVLNVSNGAFAPRRSTGLAVRAKLGDRIAIYVGKKDVDAETPLSVVFNRPIWAGGSNDVDDVDAYLHTVLQLERSAPAPTSAPASPVMSYEDVTATARFGLDSDGRRVTVELPSSLLRGGTYRLTLKTSIAAATGSGPGLLMGQVQQPGGPSPPLSEPIRLTFKVRAVPDPLASFSVPGAAIRDLSLNGNILLLTSGQGGIRAYDVADPGSLSSATTQPLGYVQPGSTDFWAVASDLHGRVYATGTDGLFGFVQSYRLEDFIGAAGAPQIVTKTRSSATVCWVPGSSSGPTFGSDTLSDRPEGFPRKLQLAVQDDDVRYDTRDELVAGITAFGGSANAAVITGSDDKKIKVTVPRQNGFAYRTQRITVENLTRDMRWSGDATDSGPAEIDNIIARPNDQLRIVFNLRTYGIVTIFGYGVGVFDLNAVESNDLPNAPSGYRAVSERVRIADGALRRECPGQDPTNPDAIAHLGFSPETAVLPTATTGQLRLFGVDVHKGVLDLTVDLSTTPTVIPGPSCDNRAPSGLLLTGEQNERIYALEQAFGAASGGRTPFRH
ncbi:MAG: hypothetical protein JWO56_154, partial [Acidobacteria bacterium]|nr:hypothetical protein [Acidobacteriota bacterium]